MGYTVAQSCRRSLHLRFKYSRRDASAGVGYNAAAVDTRYIFVEDIKLAFIVHLKNNRLAVLAKKLAAMNAAKFTSRLVSIVSRLPHALHASISARSSALAWAICLNAGIRTGNAGECDKSNNKGGRDNGSGSKSNDSGSKSNGSGIGTCRSRRYQLEPHSAESAKRRCPASSGCAPLCCWLDHRWCRIDFGAKKRRFGCWSGCHAPCSPQRRC